ncbi:MAG: transcriptional repressor [Dehalococcoidia bacterium]
MRADHRGAESACADGKKRQGGLATCAAPARARRRGWCASGKPAWSEHADRDLGTGAPISLSTVYRTLEGLRDAGLVAAHEAQPGATTFEWAHATTTHHHLRCVRCGRTLEVELPRLTALEAEIRARTGFEASTRHLAISGVCRDCAQAEVAR